ncbi:winged helix-turn-helix transcriptional regulator [Protofrankia coriariae]|uniref:winged helix-turn-helix transcriptional regulator n=1 Tax=Protofrankia coriariae TaxID=1562887 RepID=UPI001F2D76D1|nr:winged helix-turn-helix transcriptional regulator [Protofrankia coriariae]
MRWLEARGLVEHTREEQFPFPTSYRLTPPAEELVELLEPLAAWARKHEDLLLRDQRERSRRRRA